MSQETHNQSNELLSEMQLCKVRKRLQKEDINTISVAKILAKIYKDRDWYLALDKIPEIVINLTKKTFSDTAADCGLNPGTETWRVLIQAVLLDMHAQWLEHTALLHRYGAITSMAVNYDAAYGMRAITRGIEAAETVHASEIEFIDWPLLQQSMQQFLDPHFQPDERYKAAKMLSSDPSGITHINDAVKHFERITSGNPPESSLYSVPPYLDPRCVMAGVHLGQAVFTALTTITQEIEIL